MLEKASDSISAVAMAYVGCCNGCEPLTVFFMLFYFLIAFVACGTSKDTY